MERVKKGEKYWYIDQDNGCFYVDYDFEGGTLTDERRFQNGNYFTSEELAESTVNKFNAVLKGADVIEMPCEEEADMKSAYMLGLTEHFDEDNTGYAYLDGFADCLHWLKSKVK